MKRIWSSIVILALSLTIGSQAEASTSSVGYINDIIPLHNGTIVFNHTGSRSQQPGCATVPGRWAIDGSTPTGQLYVAALLTAYSLHKQIDVVGSSTCTAWPDTETVDYFHIVD